MILNKIIERDYEFALKNWWQNISPVAKKSFIWVFLIINLVFAWHTITFIPDNHSLGLIKTGIHLNFQFDDYNGRFSGGMLQQLTGGNLFPIFNDVLCFAFLTLSLILLANYWNLPKTVLSYTLFSLFIALMPYVLPWVYFIRHQTYFINIFLITYALTLLLKPNTVKILICSALFVICLGTYFTMVQYIGIAFLGRLLSDRLFQKRSLNDLYITYKQTLISIIIAFYFFIIIEMFLYIGGKINPIPQTEFNFFSLQKIGMIIATYFTSTHYMSLPVKLLLITPFFLTTFWIILKKDYLALLMVFASLITCNFINLISISEYIYMTRIQFFGTPWLYALFTALLLKRENEYKNFAFIIILISVWYSALQDMKWQKSFYFEEIKEINEWMQVIDIVKNHPNFDNTKMYNVFLVGELSYRQSFDPETTHLGNIPQIKRNQYIYGSFSEIYKQDIFNFFEKRPYVKKVYNADETLISDIIKDKTAFCKTLKSDLVLYSTTYIESNFIVIFPDQNLFDKVKGEICGITNFDEKVSL